MWRSLASSLVALSALLGCASLPDVEARRAANGDYYVSVFAATTEAVAQACDGKATNVCKGDYSVQAENICWSDARPPKSCKSAVIRCKAA